MPNLTNVLLQLCVSLEYQLGGGQKRLSEVHHNFRRGDFPMVRRIVIATALAVAAMTWMGSVPNAAQAQEHAYGAVWGSKNSMQNMDRFYHYPYVTYPQNYWGNDYYRSAESNYYRYPPEMRIPVYNKSWHNYYPTPRRYHFGHHFVTDIF